MNQNLSVNKTNFHMKGFALGLGLKQRRNATRKSPILYTLLVLIIIQLWYLVSKRVCQPGTAIKCDKALLVIWDARILSQFPISEKQEMAFLVFPEQLVVAPMQIQRNTRNSREYTAKLYKNAG